MAHVGFLFDFIFILGLLLAITVEGLLGLLGLLGLGVVIFMMRETAEGHEIEVRGAGDGAGVCSSFSYLLSWPHPSLSVAFFDILSRGGGLDG